MNSEEPILLILESSGRVGQVALARGPQLLSLRRLDEARRHARDLAPAVADLVAEQGLMPRAVEAVIVNRGPGSYTGLRVGIMSAKTFAYSTGCALLAVDSFAAVAVQAPPQVAHLAVIADAQQDKIYVQNFRRAGSPAEWRPESLLNIQKLDDWQARLQATVWVSGPGLHDHRSRLRADISIVNEVNWDPRPESLLSIGLLRYLAGERDDLWTVEPLYLRPSAAEEKWQARSSH
jgi:tRNA threonylcarbamoyladenosine biosynthesis protein TsaB